MLAVRLMLASGMRRGETLGLQWKSVDFDKGTVRICQTLNESCELKSPKTDNGYRNFYLDSYTLEHLRHWHEFQGKMLHLINVNGSPLEQNGETFVCCSDTGGFIDPTNFGRWWNGFRETIGFPSLLVHEYRHTHVTLLRGRGIDEQTIQDRVGHGNPSTVTRLYTHELPAHDMPAAEAIGQILYETKVEDEDNGSVIQLQKTA